MTKEAIKNAEEKTLTLDEVSVAIVKYAEAKEVEKEIKPDLNLGNAIKKFLKENNLNNYGVLGPNGEQISVSVTYRDNTQMDEEKAIEILKKSLGKDTLKEVVKKREYIDEDALENLMYNNVVPRNILQDALVHVPPTAVLKYKVKAGE